MKPWFTAIIAWAVTFLSISAHADSLELGLSNEVVELEFQADFSKAYAVDVAYLHSIYEDKSKNLTSAGIYAQVDTQHVYAKLGGKFLWLNTSDSNTYGVALGGSVIGYIIPKLWLGGEAFYTPNILLGGDYSTYYDVGVNIGYDVMEHATLFLGYRNIAADENKNTLGVYKGVMVGFKFKI